MNRFFLIAAAASTAVCGSASALSFDSNVTPNVIFGSGNANGSFTVDQQNGVELGLRGKLRHNASGAPENTFNSNGDGTYTFNPGVAPTQSFPTGEWSFEWSINSDFDDSTGQNLDDLTYSLEMSSTNAASIGAFDPINDPNPGAAGQVQWDHGIGTNATGNGGGTSIPNDGDGDDDGYGSLIANNNVAQNSWKPHWFAPAFDPTLAGQDYDFTLTAFDSSGGQVAQTSITVKTTPTPTAAVAGLVGLGLVVSRRRRRA